VKLATFLDQETILVQVSKRYLMFDQNGEFIDEIEFTDEALPPAPPTPREDFSKS